MSKQSKRHFEVLMAVRMTGKSGVGHVHRTYFPHLKLHSVSDSMIWLASHGFLTRTKAKNGTRYTYEATPRGRAVVQQEDLYATEETLKSRVSAEPIVIIRIDDTQYNLTMEEVGTLNTKLSELLRLGR